MRLLGLLGASAMLAAMASGCGHRNDDINTVQPGYVRKSIFQTNDEWYMRRTIVKAETTNELAIEGTGDIFLDRVKFEIQEDYLIAYRPYEDIPGGHNQNYEGSLGYHGAVLAAWPIVSHFDIKRGYDPATGNVTNTIDENTTDKHWYDRPYMRVDWANNIVEGNSDAGWSAYEMPLTWISTGAHWQNLDEDPTDPYASRFTDDYVDITAQVFLGMDLINCAAFVAYSYDGFGICGFGEAKLRTNFTRIKQKSDFIPRDYPDSVVRVDPNTGKVIYDDETGEVSREPLLDRFGYYRVELPTYDRGYGTTESGRIFRALIFNIWKKNRDERGNEIPMAQREPNPIIYYVNVDYPERWMKSAQEVASEYNRVLKKMVADVKGVPCDMSRPGACTGVPDMFEIRRNDCNIGNVKSFVSNNKDLEFAVRRAVCRNGEDCASPLDKIAIGNLENVCTSVEAASRDPNTGIPAFEWQRHGDVRYKMVMWLNNPQQSGWSGYGPMHSDGLTGESVSATAHLRGWTLETAIAEIVNYIEFINSEDDSKITDTIYGQDVRKHVAATLKNKKVEQSLQASDKYLGTLEKRLARLGSTKQELLKEVDPNSQINRLKRLEGSRIESDYLIDDLQLMFASKGKWKPGMPVSDELRRAASPVGRIVDQNPLAEMRLRGRRAMANAGFCFLKHDFDPHYAGLALALKDLPREKRYEVVGNMFVKHVMLHELGHNFGLEHNFEGTYDALNYFDEFWNNHWATDEEKVANRYDEHRNTSVMEYLSDKGTFTNRLGKYDEAAIRFGYVNQVQVFDKADIQGGQALKNWRYLNDYSQIPGRLCGGNGCASPEEAQRTIQQRKWVTFDPQNPPANEVPYLYCNNAYDRRTPFCATFDYGSNLREIFANYHAWWQYYFFFNNFIRDRLTPLAWNPNYATVPALYGMFDIVVVNQYLYYLSSLDKDFIRNTGLGQDMATTVANGLNFASEIMSTPEPIRMCPWPGATNPQIFIPWYYTNDCDQYAPITSQYAIDAEAIQIPLGVGRPATLGLTDDFVDFDIAFIGSYFDKSNVMWLLGLQRSSFLRFNYELDRRSYSINLFRLFEPELRSFYDKMMRLDGYTINQSTATDLGSYWCRDENNPQMAYLGHFEARRMIDPASTTNPSLPGPSTSCRNAGVIYPELLRNMPFNAMWYAYALFSSPLDAQLDMSKSLKVFVLGSDDEYPGWRSLPPDDVCSCVDQLTGLDYRSVRQPRGPNTGATGTPDVLTDIPDLGCRLIERACEAQEQFEADPAQEFYRERWRAWFERLEFARDLARIYDR